MTAILMDATVYPERGAPPWIRRSVILVAETGEEAKDAAWDWIADVECTARSIVLTTPPTLRWHPTETQGLRPWDVYAELLITEKERTNV
jgi:hypothetical protein